jgi:hypothetical protein
MGHANRVIVDRSARDLGAGGHPVRRGRPSDGGRRTIGRDRGGHYRGAVSIVRAEIDGHAAPAGELRHLALVNYGHFTAMQVRDQAVRGLDRHLQRLDTATLELYGTGPGAEQVRARIRHALGAEISDATVRVTVFQPDPGGRPSVLVTVRTPAEPPDLPQRLQSLLYQ